MKNQLCPTGGVLTKNLMFPLVVLITAFSTAAAAAGTVTLQLVRSSRAEVGDVAGLWQHEGGNIRLSGRTIGKYVIVRRVTRPATNPQSVSTETITLFIGPLTELHNITLQGAHHMRVGNFKGSVSAASNQYSWIIGADSGYISTGSATSALTMNWLGSNQLNVP